MKPVIEGNPGEANSDGAHRHLSELILIVEDDVDLLKLIEKSLTSHGYRTASAPSGATALTWLERHYPDLMILDYSLPDMHGEQLLHGIESRGRRIPFVVATGHGSESVAVEMMKRGAYDYIVKGTSFLKLLPALVNRALERARQLQRLAKAEEELHRAHEELEQRVEQRTAELAEANQRLRVEMEERKHAEQLAQQHLAELAHVTRLSTMGEMVTELAHELNQPLSAICSHAQACKRLLESGFDSCGEELAVSLNQVNEQGTRAAEIIRRLRHFVAKAKPLESLVAVNAMIHDVADLLSADASAAEAEVVLELTEPLPGVVVDRIQLEQVLVNLMRNAFESLRESHRIPRRLVVRTATDGPRDIVVDVRDNGPGFAAEAADHIFERFFTTKANGMGMGLSISQSIIKNYGGRLWAVPAPDGGAVFRFTLPIEIGEHIRGR